MWTPGRREGRRTISLHRPDSDSVLPDLYTLSILLSKVTSSRGQYWERDHDYYLYNLSHFWPCYTVILLYTYISIILDWSHDILPKSSLHGELFDSGFFFFNFGQSKNWRKSPKFNFVTLFPFYFRAKIFVKDPFKCVKEQLSKHSYPMICARDIQLYSMICMLSYGATEN